MTRARRPPGAWGAAAACASAALALTGCGALPPLPDPVPTALTVIAEPLPSSSLPSSSPGGALSPDGFDAAIRMSVRIRNVGCGSLSTGSGFAIDDHTLVTNRHVVSESAALEISTYDGRDVRAQAASSAPLADLAFVRTVDPLPAFGGLAPTDPVPGASVTIVGYPRGSRLTMTTGNVIGATTDPLNENLGEVLVTDARVELGSSGSPVLDSQGRVVGVVYARGEDGASFVVPVSTLREMLDDESQVSPAPTCTD
ncbi:S1 family peptidase [Cellulomonas palmilytica]|uniref:S1 family peptidase n=1 Tax=Cellulomonas palmilytica TaxID=2608402 RepID=UPI001F204382|nr:serine protease [Cellulomonas palmilytica]UJP38792.1 trypsin-like peptidase domain-containing protein [Cellulomonas palmilytica]